MVRSSPAENLKDLWASEPSLLIGPAVASLALGALWTLPSFAAFASVRGIEPWGWAPALQYTVFAILLSFGFHGAVSTFVEDDLKLQATPRTPLRSTATRSTAVLLTSLVYTALPLRPVSASWWEFLWTCALYAVFWDAEFYTLHRLSHRYGWMYRTVHKLHHTIKDPNCFTAYYVTYASHFLLEQAPTIACCIAFLPRDAFIFSIYLATLSTYVDHGGFDVKDKKLFGELTFGQVLTFLYANVAPLGLVETCHHDYHHERFNYNYSLYFTYLDKLFGTYHQGRTAPAKAAASTAADDKED